jgi:hypothetical protein
MLLQPFNQTNQKIIIDRISSFKSEIKKNEVITVNVY